MSSVRPYLPILATLGAVAALSLMDAFMKSASLAIGAYSAAWLRSALGLAIVLPVWLMRDAHWPERAPLKLHLERGVVSTFMALSFFYALTKLPIAEAIAISFVAPIIALYLARILLGEQVRREAVVAAVLGFVGTLVIVGGRIGHNTFDADMAKGLAAILFSALLYAYNFILIRRQSQVAGPIEIAVFHSGVSAVLLGFGAPLLFITPDLQQFGSVAAGAVLTVLGAIGLAWAYAREEAQILVPLEYSGFLWAALFGWLFFREPLVGTTMLGTLLIVIGCWLASRKRPEQSAI